MKLQQITVLEPSSPRVICSDRTLNGKDAKFEAGDDGKRIWRWDTISLKIARGTDEVCSVAIQNDGPRDIQLRKVCLDWPAAVFSPRLDTREYIELHHTRSMHEVPGVRPCLPIGLRAKRLCSALCRLSGTGSSDSRFSMRRRIGTAISGWACSWNRPAGWRRGSS